MEFTTVKVLIHLFDGFNFNFEGTAFIILLLPKGTVGIQ